MTCLFISHSSDDRAEADFVKSSLEGAGLKDVFLDFDIVKGIAPGSKWFDEIFRTIRASMGLVAVVSESFGKSPWCFAETVFAEIEGVPIFPVLIKGATLPPRLSDDQAVVIPSVDHVDYANRVPRSLFSRYTVSGFRGVRSRVLALVGVHALREQAASAGPKSMRIASRRMSAETFAYRSFPDSNRSCASTRR